MDYGTDIFEEFLETIGAKSYEELSTDEKEAYESLFNKAKARPLNLDDFRAVVHDLRVSLDKELATHNHSMKKDLFLKARLANCILFEETLTSQDDAIKALQDTIENIKIKRGLTR